MTSIDPIPMHSCDHTRLGHPNTSKKRSLPVFFERHELDRILTVYGRMVAAGEWRDYAIDSLRDFVSFSVFRHFSEVPLYRIEKRPKLMHKHSLYIVITASGMSLKRGNSLDPVLKIFDKKKIRLVGKVPAQRLR